MKKHIIPLLCVVLLCGCADNTESSADSAADVTAVTENTTEAETTEPAEGLSFEIDQQSIELFIDGEYIQTIDLDYMPQNYHIKTIDYDFDGYDDLFIPTLIGRPNTPGIYYHYNVETGLLEEWEELNTIGCLMNVNDDDTLINNISISAVDHKTITYKWNNGNLQEISYQTQYCGSDNEIYIDAYEYDENGNEILVKRERVILDEDHNWLGTEEVEIQPDYSFSVNENSVDVINDGELVQTLECTPMNENMLISDDYNFDGYNDLFAITDIQDVKLSGIYYKFNPETSMFEEWEELNRFGYSFDTGISSNLSIGKVLSYDTDNHERFIYKWEDDDLILVEKIITVIDKHNNKATTEIYCIDADGNETLIESSERDLDENPLDFD